MALPPVPNFTGPTSEVVADVSRWEDRSLLIPHEPIRQDLREFERLLAPHVFDGTQEWKVNAFFTYYNDCFFPNVHHHHDAEEEIFFPWLAARAPQIPERMTADHETLIRALEEIRGMQGAFAKSEGLEKQRAAAKVLRERVRTLTEELTEHLAEEERFFVPVLRAKFSEKEHAQMISKIMQSLGLGGCAKMLPWILYAMHQWGGAGVVKGFKEEVPLPIRLLNQWFWYPAYLKARAHLLAMELSQEPGKTHSLKRQVTPTAGRHAESAAVGA